jgi:hypothetical protein
MTLTKNVQHDLGLARQAHLDSASQLQATMARRVLTGKL